MSPIAVPISTDCADPTPQWTAAYVLGLAYSAQDDHDCAAEILRAVGGQATLVAQAATLLDEASVGDPLVRTRALRLLGLALEAARDGCLHATCAG